MDENRWEWFKAKCKNYKLLQNITEKLCKNTNPIDLFFDILNVNQWRMCLEGQKTSTNK